MPVLPDFNLLPLFASFEKKISMPIYSSIENALYELNKAGYICRFIKKDNYFHCPEKDMNFYTHELEITEAYRYENKISPQQNAVVYAIEAAGYGLKGVLLN